MMKKDILSMLPTELESELAGLGEPKYRAGQIFKWLSEGVRDFDKMSNLPKALREKLRDGYELYEPKVLSKQVSKLDGTIKYLWELRDGNAVETVVMSYKHGNTVCISSQVGCRQGCASSRRRCWTRCCFHSWIPASRYLISSLWASASRWIISITSCAFWSL